MLIKKNHDNACFVFFSFYPITTKTYKPEQSHLRNGTAQQRSATAQRNGTVRRSKAQPNQSTKHKAQRKSQPTQNTTNAKHNQKITAKIQADDNQTETTTQSAKYNAQHKQSKT